MESGSTPADPLSRVQGPGSRGQGPGSWVQGPGARGQVQSLGSGVWGLGSGVWGLGSGIQGPGSRDAVGGGDDFWPGFHPHMRHCHPKGKELHEVTFLAHPQNKIHTKSWTRTMYLQFHCPYSKKNCMHNASFALRFITYCTSQKQNPAFPEQVKCNRCVF